MKLKIQRTQSVSGLKGTVTFTIQAVAQYSEEELHAIDKYRLGKVLLYESSKAEYYRSKANLELAVVQETGNVAAGLSGIKSMVMGSMHLHITVNSLQEGERVECKTLDEALEAEDAIKTACGNVKGYIEIAKTFNGEIEEWEF